MTEKLEPCPFCGGGATLFNIFGYVVTCENAGCGVMVETTPHAKKAAAIRLWNTRKQKEPTK